VIGEVGALSIYCPWYKGTGEGTLWRGVKHRTKCGRIKRREASGALCDKTVLMRLKGKFYRSVLRSTMLLGSEYLGGFDRITEQRMRSAEMIALRWMGRVRKKIE